MVEPNAIVVSVGDVRFGNYQPLSLIAGPCQLESRAARVRHGGRAEGDVRTALAVGLVYKTSFDKANRTSAQGQARDGAGGLPCRSSPTSAQKLRPAGADGCS